MLSIFDKKKLKQEMGDQNIKYIPLHEAAKFTDYSQDYISLLCRRGKMRGKKLGRNWFTTKEWMDEYISRIEENKNADSGKNKEEIVPVKIEEKSEARKMEDLIGKVDEANEDKADRAFMNSFLSTKKIMLATIIFSIVVSGFIFVQYGARQNLIAGVDKNQIAGVLDSVSQSVQRKIISLNNYLDSVKNNSAEFAANGIIGVSNSLDVVKNESTKYAVSILPRLDGGLSQDAFSAFPTAVKTAWNKNVSQEIISLSDSLDVVKNESAKYANKKIADISNYKNYILDGVRGRVAGVSTEDPNAPARKVTFIESVKNALNGIGDYLANIFGKSETKIVQVPQQQVLQPTGSSGSSSSIIQLQDRVNKLEQEIKDKEVITITQTLKGEKGDQGSQGAIGLIGPAGEQGSIGLTGPAGPAGVAGAAGAGDVTIIQSSPVNTNVWNNGANVFSGYGSFESLSVAYDLTAGRSFGVGGNTTLGGDANDTLAVNATSTFNNPVTLSNAATLTTGTGQVSFGGDVDITGDLTVTGAQTYIGAASFTTNSILAALSVRQDGVGNIVEFKDGATSVFTISDGGDITITGSIISVAGVDLTFDSGSGIIKAATGDVFYTEGGHPIRKVGEEILRGSVPVFGYDLPSRTASTNFVTISRAIILEDVSFPDAMEGTTRAYKFSIRYADTASGGSSDWRVYNITDSVETSQFTVPSTTTTDLDEGTVYITSSAITLPAAGKKWRLEARVSAGITIQVYQVHLMAYDVVD